MQCIFHQNYVNFFGFIEKKAVRYSQDASNLKSFPKKVLTKICKLCKNPRHEFFFPRCFVKRSCTEGFLGGDLTERPKQTLDNRMDAKWRTWVNTVRGIALNGHVDNTCQARTCAHNYGPSKIASKIKIIYIV